MSVYKTIGLLVTTSDVPKWEIRVRLCICISELTLGALIGAGALITANTIVYMSGRVYRTTYHLL